MIKFRTIAAAKEDARDAKVARKALAKIKRNPALIVGGAALEKRLKQDGPPVKKTKKHAGRK